MVNVKTVTNLKIDIIFSMEWVKDKQQEEEEELLDRYLNGDNTAFGPLYYRYRTLFLYHLNKQLNTISKEDKEDLAID